jgi:hypothetical protein
MNWSNPSQGQTNTAAQIQSQFQPQTVSIAPIVAALLQKQYHDQEIQQQQYNDMIKGIGSAASGYANYQNAGAANDSANAALYGAQNPKDPFGGYQDPNRVPDYGGTDALKAYLMQQKATNNPLDDQLTQARIDAEKALTRQRNNQPFGGYAKPTNPDLNYLHSVNAYTGQLNAAQDNLDQTYGETAQQILGSQGMSKIPEVQYPGDFWHGPKTIPAETLPTSPDQQPDYYQSGDANSGNAKYLAPGVYDAASKAARDYQTLLANAPQRNTAPQGAPGLGEDGRPIQGATSSSTTSNRPGAGPLPVQMAAPSVPQADVDQAKAAPDNQGLRKEAMDAIARGKDPAAVKARYKELTGQDL